MADKILTQYQYHDHATLQGVIIPSAILKIVFAIFFNAVWALTSGGFRIVSDTFAIPASLAYS